MRKRLAAKVIYRAQEEDAPAYRESTLDVATAKLWRSVRREGRWFGPGSRRRNSNQGVQSRPAPVT